MQNQAPNIDVKEHHNIDGAINRLKTGYKSNNGNKFSENGGAAKGITNNSLVDGFNVSKLKYSSDKNESNDYVEVEFKCKRKALYRNDKKIIVKDLDYVIVQVDNGLDIGTAVSVGKKASDKMRCCYGGKRPPKTVVRLAGEDDLAKDKTNSDEQALVVSKTKEFVEFRKLDMKVTEAEWQFDRQRLTIYFTAPQRIDFRELVKDLARTFKTRIELRQISSREEAKRIGGIGSCGLSICCSTFVNEFCHVTLDHARIQQLSNNVSKLSGYCGRLKCCLLYEYKVYEEAFKKYPPLNSILELPEGKARIIKVDIFKNIVFVHIDKASVYKNVSLEELFELDKSGKVKRPQNGQQKAPTEDFKDIDPSVLEEY
jgi:cell fate regulator YaaT (PSP1 superfamily)